MLNDALETFIESYTKENLYTSIPAKVLSVSNYGDSQTIDVSPNLSRTKATGQVISNEDIIIYDVPVISPAGGGGLLSFPLVVGDNVWLNFSMRSLEEWIHSEGDKEVIPSDSRHFHITDAVAIPCIYTTRNNLKPSTENVELKFKNNSIKLLPNGSIEVLGNSGKILVNSSGDIEITPTSKVTILGDVEITGDITHTGDMNTSGTITATTDVLGGGKSLKTHTHTSTAPSTPTSPPL